MSKKIKQKNLIISNKYILCVNLSTSTFNLPVKLFSEWVIYV